MKKIKIKKIFSYNEEYVPPRCRKARVQTKTAECFIDVPMVYLKDEAKEFPLVMKVKDLDVETLYRSFNGNNYVKNDLITKEALLSEELNCRRFCSQLGLGSESEEYQYVLDFYSNYLLFGNEVWEKVVYEPGYRVYTDGDSFPMIMTQMMDHDDFAPNMFNANEFDLAAKYVKQHLKQYNYGKIATEHAMQSIADKSWYITVYDKKAVKRPKYSSYKDGYLKEEIGEALSCRRYNSVFNNFKAPDDLLETVFLVAKKEHLDVDDDIPEFTKKVMSDIIKEGCQRLKDSIEKENAK